MLHIESIHTGTELLLGQVVNTHPGFFGEELLTKLGLRLQRAVAVPDGDMIARALEEAIGRKAEIILMTGGLGPTNDDLTRELTADVLGLELEFDSKVMDAIVSRFSLMGKVPGENNRRQAMVPRGATVLPNPHGTAPGLYFSRGLRKDSPDIFLLPGPPRELYPMFENFVLPVIQKRNAERENVGRKVSWRNLFFYGLGESELAARIESTMQGRLPEGIELGYCLKNGGVIVRLLGREEEIDSLEKPLIELGGDHFVSRDGRTMVQVVEDLLRERGESVATAESCTGGYLAHVLTNLAGSSEVFHFGLVTYSNESKQRLLGLDSEIFESHGAVSEAVVSAMSGGCLIRSGSDYALALSGIAGPGGGSLEKPVGTVFIGLASRFLSTPIVIQRIIQADRETFKMRASMAAIDLLRQHLLNLSKK